MTPLTPTETENINDSVTAVLKGIAALPTKPERVQLLAQLRTDYCRCCGEWIERNADGTHRLCQCEKAKALRITSRNMTAIVKLAQQRGLDKEVPDQGDGYAVLADL